MRRRPRRPHSRRRLRSSAAGRLDGILARVERGEGIVGGLLEEGSPLEQDVNTAVRYGKESLESISTIVARAERGDSAIGVLESDEIFAVEGWHIELDIAPPGTQVERGRWPAEVPQCNRRQHVLPGMLLHVVPPPRPVELELSRSFDDWLRYEMKDLVAPFFDGDDSGVAEAAAIGRLTAAFGIEDRVVGHREGPAIVSDLDHRCFQPRAVRLAFEGCDSLAHEG